MLYFWTRGYPLQKQLNYIPNKLSIVKAQEQIDQICKIYLKTFLIFRFISKLSTEKPFTEIRLYEPK